MLDIITFIAQQFYNVFLFLDSIIIYESLTLLKLLIIIILFMIIFRFFGGNKK